MHETMIFALNGNEGEKNTFQKQIEFANQLHD